MNRRGFLKKMLSVLPLAVLRPEEAHEYDPDRCDVCGRLIRNEQGEMFCGMEMSVILDDEPNSYFEQTLSFQDFVREQLGPYKPNRDYHVCWQCWMRSLGIKP